MALQSSGQITLDDIHVEAGGSTGSEATINDSDIRGLISASSGAEMEFADFYGASSGPSLVGVVTIKVGTDIGLDSSSEAINLTGAGVQDGDVVVVAYCADTGDYGTHTGWSGMADLEIEERSYGAYGNYRYLPMAAVSIGNWASGDSNPYMTFSGGSSGGRLRAVSLVAAIFRSVDGTGGPTGYNNAAEETNGDSGMPDPPSRGQNGNSNMVVAVGCLDDDEVSMSAPSGYTLAGTISTDSSTRGGVTGSSCAVAYKFSTANVTENPGAFGGSGSDHWWGCTLRF